jgi:hypothetical protein
MGATSAGLIAWRTLRDSVDLEAVAARLLGPPPDRRGKRGGARLYWLCPFHDDHTPSLSVRRGGRTWRCFSCGARGDAINLARRLNPSLTFAEAIAVVTGDIMPTRRSTPTPALSPRRTESSDRSTGLSAEPAAEVVALGERRLWTAEGASDLAYLRGRGLADNTIRAARLGSIPPTEGVPWRAPGITIPWFERGRLALLKVRPHDAWRERGAAARRAPKYVQAYRDPDRPLGLYPGRNAIVGGRTVIVTEGELDALLVAQAVGDAAGVVTLGSASSHPDRPTLDALTGSRRWYIATDADPAGDEAAEAWMVGSARARRVRPPIGKGWTAAATYRLDLRRWWRERLAGVEHPALWTSEELSRERWGPSLDHDLPGIVIGPPFKPAPRPEYGLSGLPQTLRSLSTRGVRLDGRIVHPDIADDTETGRVVYREPPVQTIPRTDRRRRITPLVLGRQYVRADYCQIEPRILHQLLTWCGLIDWPPGDDLYTTLGGDGADRNAVKEMVNKLINGGPAPEGATGRMAEFVAASRQHRQWTAAAARVRGGVTTLTDRLIRLDADARNHAGKAVNRCVQGTAADVLHIAVLRVAKALAERGLSAEIGLLIYDELWVETDPAQYADVADVVATEMVAAGACLCCAIPVRIEEDNAPRQTGQ